MTSGTSVRSATHSDSGSGAFATSFPGGKPLNSSGGSPLRFLPRGAGRRPAMAVMSAVVVATCAALFAVIYVHASRLVAVVGVAQRIPQGQIVEVGDLRQVDISLASGVDVVPVADASAVIGKRASVTLLAGTLITLSEVGGAPELPSGQAIVGVDLKPGMMPAAGVEVGDSVLVVLTTPAGTAISGEPSSSTSSSHESRSSPSSSPSGGAQSSAPNVIATATVVGVDTSPDGSGSGDSVVSVDVPLAEAPLVADSSAAGQAALILVGGST